MCVCLCSFSVDMCRCWLVVHVSLCTYMCHCLYAGVLMPLARIRMHPPIIPCIASIYFTFIHSFSPFLYISVELASRPLPPLSLHRPPGPLNSVSLKCTTIEKSPPRPPFPSPLPLWTQLRRLLRWRKSRTNRTISTLSPTSKHSVSIHSVIYS